MSLNFPSSPSVGQIHYDSVAQYFYEWDGVVWKSITQSSSSHIQIIDDISGSFDGIETTFPITYGFGSTPIRPRSSEAVRLNLGGVIQDPTSDYYVSGSNLTFYTAPVSGLTFSAVSLGSAFNVSQTAIRSNEDNSTDANFYPVFVSGASHAEPNISTSKLMFNPSLGRLTASEIVNTSDENLKKDVHTIENAVDKINQLRGVDFVWKESDEKSMGVIAQELQKVFPELVVEENNELSVNYNGLIAVLIEVVKELSKGKD